eukprot:9007507-Prorocentrum_lima.AAC.1
MDGSAARLRCRAPKTGVPMACSAGPSHHPDDANAMENRSGDGKRAIAAGVRKAAPRMKQ